MKLTNTRHSPVWACGALMLSLALSACGGGGSDAPTPQLKPDMSVTMAAKPDDVMPGGESIAYTFKIQNSGAGQASSVDLVSLSDSQLENINLRCTANTGSPALSCPGGLNQRMTIKDWAPGASLTVELSGNLRSGARGPVTLGFDVRTDNDAGTGTKHVEHRFQAYSNNLVLVGQGPTSRVPAGGSFAYVLDLSNAGPDAAHNVQLSNLMLAAADRSPVLGTKTCVASGGAVCPDNLQQSALNKLEIPSGGRLVITLPYQFAPGVESGLIFNATASTLGDSDRTNNSYNAIAR